MPACLDLPASILMYSLFSISILCKTVFEYMHVQHCDCITVLCICLYFVHGCLEMCFECWLNLRRILFSLSGDAAGLCSCRFFFACLRLWVYIYVKVHISMLVLVAALQKVVQFSLVYGTVSLWIAAQFGSGVSSSWDVGVALEHLLAESDLCPGLTRLRRGTLVLFSHSPLRERRKNRTKEKRNHREDGAERERQGKGEKDGAN